MQLRAHKSVKTMTIEYRYACIVMPCEMSIQFNRGYCFVNKATVIKLVCGRNLHESDGHTHCAEICLNAVQMTILLWLGITVHDTICAEMKISGYYICIDATFTIAIKSKRIISIS
jgi:hypothetical protein